MGSSFVRGAVSWLQLLCFSSSTTNILYTCTHLELIPPTASDRDRIRGEIAGKSRGNCGKVSGKFRESLGCSIFYLRRYPNPGNALKYRYTGKLI